MLPSCILRCHNKTNYELAAGPPRFATRAEEFSVPVHVQDLSGSGKYIGASAVQGRYVYGHKVLRSAAIKAVYTPGSLGITAARGAAVGTTVLTVTGSTNGTLAYKINPSQRAAYNVTSTAYGGTALTSGTTEVSVAVGDVIEVVSFVSSKAVSVGYITVTAAMLKSA